MRLSADWGHDAIDKEWQKWNAYTLKLQGIEAPKEQEETENDTKRRRRSRLVITLVIKQLELNCKKVINYLRRPDVSAATPVKKALVEESSR